MPTETPTTVVSHSGRVGIEFNASVQAPQPVAVALEGAAFAGTASSGAATGTLSPRWSAQRKQVFDDLDDLRAGLNRLREIAQAGIGHNSFPAAEFDEALLQDQELRGECNSEKPRPEVIQDRWRRLKAAAGVVLRWGKMILGEVTKAAIRVGVQEAIDKVGHALPAIEEAIEHFLHLLLL